MSCSKTDDVTPTTTSPSSADVCQTSAKTVYVEIDASTKDGAAGFTKAYSCSATSSDTIYLDIKAKGSVDKLYMKKVDENGTITKYDNSSQMAPALVNSKTVDGNTVTTGVGYTYQLPSKDASNNTIDYKNTALKLKIPVTKRTSGSPKYDIYTFWITSNTGDFDDYNKKNTFGPITVALTYGTDKPLVSTSSSVLLGTQSNSNPSYLSSSPAGIITILGTYLNTITDATEKMNTLNVIDINFVALDSNASSSSCGSKDTPWFISTGLRHNYSCLTNQEGTVFTKMAKVTLPSGETFATMSADDITTLIDNTNPSTTKVKVENNSYYVYVTYDNRMGLIQTTNLSTITAGSGTVDVDAKVVVQ